MATVISNKMHDFIVNRLNFLKSLKTLNEQQTMFCQLAEKYLSETELNSTELRGLKTLATAEQAEEKAAQAKRAARKLITEQNDQNRKQRTHNMINAAGLLGLAGLLDKATGKPLTSNERLLGALVELANQIPTEQEKHRWDEIGRQVLEAAKAKKTDKKLNH